MTEASRHDAWHAAESYDAYMGRWSSRVAPDFLSWLGVEPNRDWLDLGCGTGALSAAIVAACDPKSVVALDLSDGFVAQARSRVEDPRVDVRVGSAEAIDLPDDSRDAVVSALLLNFLPNKDKALAEARRVARKGGTIGLYVWDYPGHGLEFVDAFWRAAASVDPAAQDLDEARRFPLCAAAGLTELLTRAGLNNPECTAIEVSTTFADLEDYWRPFTLGAGPAPGYCASLSPENRRRLKDRLRGDLGDGSDGPIRMTARAWAVRSRNP